MWPIPQQLIDMARQAEEMLHLAELAQSIGIPNPPVLEQARVIVAQHTRIADHYSSELAALLPGLGYHGT